MLRNFLSQKLYILMCNGYNSFETSKYLIKSLLKKKKFRIP